MLHISIVYIVVVESLLLLFKDTGPVAEPFVEFIFVGKKLVSQFAIVLSDVDLDFVSGAVVQDDELGLERNLDTFWRSADFCALVSSSTERAC